MANAAGFIGLGVGAFEDPTPPRFTMVDPEGSRIMVGFEEQRPTMQLTDSQESLWSAP
jgi:hypothetical protein